MEGALSERFVSEEERSEQEEGGGAPSARPSSVSDAKEQLRQWVALSYPTVTQFLSGTLSYVLSRQWIDLFATSLLHLHPLPFCSADDSQLPCTPEAPALVQAQFAGVVLLIAAAIERLCSANTHRFPSLRRVPQMSGMWAGWAFGGASVQALSELSERCVLSCTSIHIAFSLLATIASAVLILVLRPATLEWAWGSVCELLCGKQQPHAARPSRLLEELWQLCRRAVSVMVMMLWNFSLKMLVRDGVPQPQTQGVLYERMLLFYAISLTSFGALATTHFVRWRQRIAEGAPRVPPLSSGPRRLARLKLLLNRRLALIQFLTLLEQTSGWVIGCAWIDYVVAYFHSDDFPTGLNTLKDLGVAMFLTLFAILWLALTGSDQAPPSHKTASGNRGEFEKYFLSNAMSFFVGWEWVNILRDLSILTARALGARRDERSVWAYTSFAIIAFVFGPVLTYLLLRFEQRGLAAYNSWRAALLGLPPTPLEDVALERVELCMRRHEARPAHQSFRDCAASSPFEEHGTFGHPIHWAAEEDPIPVGAEEQNSSWHSQYRKVDDDDNYVLS